MQREPILNKIRELMRQGKGVRLIAKEIGISPDEPILTKWNK